MGLGLSVGTWMSVALNYPFTLQWRSIQLLQVHIAVVNLFTANFTLLNTCTKLSVLEMHSSHVVSVLEDVPAIYEYIQQYSRDDLIMLSQ